MMETYIDVDQACSIINRSRATVCKLCKEGVLTARKDHKDGFRGAHW